MKAKTVVFGWKGGHQHRVTRRLGQGGGPNRCKWARDRVGGSRPAASVSSAAGSAVPEQVIPSGEPHKAFRPLHN